MSDSTPIQKMLRPQRRVRYLKMIAVFKIIQGLLLFSVGISLLVLHSRARWLDAISDWVDGELMVAHSRSVLYLLSRLQDAVAGGLLEITGWVALFFALVRLRQWVRFSSRVAAGRRGVHESTTAAGRIYLLAGH